MSRKRKTTSNPVEDGAAISRPRIQTRSSCRTSRTFQKMDTNNNFLLTEEDQLILIPLILPHLPLHDLSNVIATNPKLLPVLDNYLEAGNTITLDPETLARHPLASDVPFYKRFSKATSLNLHKIEDRSLGPIFTFFRSLTRLTLRDMQLLGDDRRALPSASVVDLRMYDVSVECGYFQELFRHTKHIRSLRMHDSATYFLNRHVTPPKAWHFKLTDAALTDLELEEAKKAADPNTTYLGKKSFRHETAGLVNAVSECQTLEHLELGGYIGNDSIDPESRLFRDLFKQSTKLRTLKLKAWWPVEHFPSSLEHLSVTGLVDPKYKEAIDALQLKTANVEYFEPPTEPNLLLRMLNNDCLQHLLRFLPLADCLAFADTDWRVRDVMVRYRFPVLTVTQQVEIMLRDRRGYFEEMAPFIRKLRVYQLSPLLDYLSLCTSLRSLCMTWINIPDVVMMQIPETVQQVSLSGCRKDKTMAPQKKRKSLRGYQQKALGQLREITVDSQLDDELLAEFLHYGRNSLQRLNVRMQQSPDLESYADVWPVLAGIPTMQHLMLQRDYGPTTTRRGGNADGLERDRMAPMYKLLGGKLLKLHVDVRSDELACYLNDQLLGQLEELQLTTDYHARLGLSAWKGVYSLKNLRKFRLGKWGRLSPKVSEQEVLRVVRELPKLEQFEVPAFSPSAGFGRQLKALLDEERRTLRFFTLAPHLKRERFYD